MDPKNKINLPKNMSWEILKRFNTVTNSSSFIGAAKKIGTSKAALLNQLDSLEADIGKYLFIRYKQNRSLELTPEGQKLKEITSKLSRIIDERMSDLITSCQDDRKSIKIITTPGLATTLLPKPISSFKNQYKNLKIKLDISPVPPQIKVGEVLIRNDFLPQENLKTVKVFDFESCFYASKDYIKQYGSPKTYNDIINHKLFSIKYYNISSVDKYTFEQNKYIHVDPEIESSYISFLIEMALLGHGIVELPSLHPATKKLVHISTLPSTIVDIYAGFLNIANQDDLVYKFINYLVENKDDRLQ